MAQVPLGKRLTFLLADQEATDNYNPINHDPQHDAKASRFAAGKYASFFIGDDLKEPNKEIAMVGTNGSSTAYCTSGAPNHKPGELDLEVNCIDIPTSARVNSKYSSLVVGAGSLPQTLAFAVADQPTADSYTPDTSRSFTTGKLPMLIERIDVGDWYVHLGTSSPQGTMYHVNSADVNSICNIGEWKNFGIRVKCFDHSGAPADVKYKVLQVTRGRPGVAFGSAWADLRFNTTIYNPYISFFTSNGVDGSTTIERKSVGTYQVVFTGAVPSGTLPENVLVSPFGLVFAACNVVNQSQGSAGERQWAHVVDVECRDAHGKPFDSRFTITLIE